MSRRVYVAAPFARAPEASARASALRSLGHSVVSSWHDSPPPAAWENDPTRRAAVCERNLADLRKADTIVLLADVTCRGALIELAIAWAWGLRCVVVPVGAHRLDLTLMAELPGVSFVSACDVEVALR